MAVLAEIKGASAAITAVEEVTAAAGADVEGLETGALATGETRGTPVVVKVAVVVVVLVVVTTEELEIDEFTELQPDVDE